MRKVSKDELYAESDGVIQINVKIDRKAKKLTEELYSPKWGRKITVQQIDGDEFLELHAAEELEKENFEEIAEDVLLALDLIRSWATANKFAVVDQEIEPPSFEEMEQKPASKNRSSKASRE